MYMLKYKKTKSILLVMMLLFILPGCNQNTTNEIEVDQTGINNTEVIVDTEEPVNTNQFVIDDIIIIEDMITGLYEMTYTIDEFYDYMAVIMPADALKNFSYSFIYGPHFNNMPLIEVDNNPIMPIYIYDTLGLSIEEVKNQYGATRDQYINQYFGSYELVDVLYSDVYTEYGLNYVYTKRVVKVDHYGDDPIEELILFRKYIISEEEGHIKITDVEILNYFDPSLSWQKEILEKSRPSMSSLYDQYNLFKEDVIEYHSY